MESWSPHKGASSGFVWKSFAKQQQQPLHYFFLLLRVCVGIVKLNNPLPCFPRSLILAAVRTNTNTGAVSSSCYIPLLSRLY
jgi:hypothetical protein